MICYTLCSVSEPSQAYKNTLNIILLKSVVRKMNTVIHWIVIFYPVLKMLLNAIKLNVL